MQDKISPEEFRKAAYPDVVIWDTLLDLPKLKSMTPQGRMAWWRSLGDLERKQLVEVSSQVVGLGLGMTLIEMGEAITKGKAK